MLWVRDMCGGECGKGDVRSEKCRAHFPLLTRRCAHLTARALPDFTHWIWLVPAFLIGACIGSFLNVVIYRVPLGMSVNEPSRSFCPKCKTAIPMWRNIPLISWLALRGKCADCGAPIAFRYFGVELLTAILFTVVWRMFPPIVVVPLWVGIALWVAVTFIDIEHLVIPTGLTWGGVAAGVAGCLLWPVLPVLATGSDGTWLAGLKQSALGWGIGFFGLWGIVELGKMAFGKRKVIFDEPEKWHLREPAEENEPVKFVMGEEEIPWWDLFYRKSDTLVLECTAITLDGSETQPGTLLIREEKLTFPDGKERLLADVKSLAGTAVSAVIPREAMGFGDVHLMGMIGAFFGWGGVLFALFASSLFAIIAAVIGRIGFGKQLPYGPFLVMGALAWAFGGWRLWEWYLGFLLPQF